MSTARGLVTITISQVVYLRGNQTDREKENKLMRPLAVYTSIYRHDTPGIDS